MHGFRSISICLKHVEIRSDGDMSFYYMKKEEEETPQGATAFYVDDTPATRNAEYEKNTKQIPNKF